MNQDEQQVSPRFRQGVLAGLSAEERHETVDRALQRGAYVSKASADEILKVQSVDHAPIDTMVGVMADWDNDMLTSTALDYGIEPAVYLTNEALLDAIVDGIAKDMGDCLTALQYAGEAEFASIESCLKAGGHIEFGEDEAQQHSQLKTFSPYSFMFFKDGLYTFLIPDVYLENFRKIDLEAVKRFRMRMGNVIKTASAMVDLYGIVTLPEALEQMHGWYGEEVLPAAEAIEVLRRGAMSHGYDFSVWQSDGTDYLLHYMLDEEFIRRKEGQSDAELEAMISYRQMLLDARRTIKPKPFDRDVADMGVLAYKESANAVVGLRAYLDAHVPADENDYIFADKVIDSVLASTIASFDMEQVSAYLEDVGLGELLDSAGELTRLVARVGDELPAWQYRGYSARERREDAPYARTKVMGADGKLTKVGRNDPCPCGSGKKYKNCCGK